MRFRFIGKYTNGHVSVSIHGVTFEGHEPVSVDDDTALRLMTHPEVEDVADEDEKPRRGRPRKAD